MTKPETLWTSLRRKLAPQLVTRPLLCACRALDGEEYVGWRPCPTSLCERHSHVFAHRLLTSSRDYRYGGFSAWLRWVFKGIPADEED